MNLCDQPHPDGTEIVTASELREGDHVDMIESNTLDPFSFVYTDELAEYEMGCVDEIDWESEDCIAIYFDNLTAVAVSPRQQFVIAARP